MLAVFCLRLACGLGIALLLLPDSQLNPRFYRAHFLTILGLSACATAGIWQSADGLLRVLMVAALASSSLGSLVWSLDRAPAARLVGPIVAVVLVVALARFCLSRNLDEGAASSLIDNLSSAALLGIATTAMLVGHSYLIAPAMSIKPLTRMLGALALALAIRLAVAAVGLTSWTREHSLAKLDEITLLLPVRWGLGFVAPGILAYMAWQTAKIRSTQSATGILYVVVIFCFLGELISQLLYEMTGSVF